MLPVHTSQVSPMANNVGILCELEGNVVIVSPRRQSTASSASGFQEVSLSQRVINGIGTYSERPRRFPVIISTSSVSFYCTVFAMLERQMVNSVCDVKG